MNRSTIQVGRFFYASSTTSQLPLMLPKLCHLPVSEPPSPNLQPHDSNHYLADNHPIPHLRVGDFTHPCRRNAHILSELGAQRNSKGGGRIPPSQLVNRSGASTKKRMTIRPSSNNIDDKYLYLLVNIYTC